MDFPMDFGCFESESSMFCLKLLLILNFTTAVLSKTTFRSIFVSYSGRGKFMPLPLKSKIL
jgi:hypothetical protein